MPKILIVLITGFFFVSVRSQVALDGTFGNGGTIVHSAYGENNRLNKMAVQDDGKIVSVGSLRLPNVATVFLVMRTLPNGQLDQFFGIDGIVLTNYSAKCFAYDVKIQDDGKIVVSGVSYSELGGAGVNTADIMVVRYNEDGSIDTTFGVDGIRAIELPGIQSGSAIQLLPDGSMLVNGFSNDYALVKLTSAGAIDTTFGTNGFIDDPINWGFDDSALTSDGKLVVAGGVALNAVAIGRLNPDGSPDTSYGTNGGTMASYGTSSLNSVVAYKNFTLAPTGELFISASYYNGIKYNSLIIKFDENGIIDSSFGENGFLFRDFGLNLSSFVSDIAIDSAGKLLVGYTAGPTNDYDFVVSRYSASGVLDTSFGNDGSFSVVLGPGQESLSQLIIPTEGQILLGGSKGGFGFARLIESSLSVTESNLETVAKIFPVPLNEMSVVQINADLSSPINVQVIDISGKIVSDQIFPAQTEKINLDYLAMLKSGCYFLQIYIAGKRLNSVPFVK